MTPQSTNEIFCDLHEPFDLKKAQIEAHRCYYCYDAPCIQACPTEIDIPSFIRKISNDNIKGAALDILSANIMGGTCARACPVETLCQSACVREKSEKEPVLIGQLQRFATDEYFKTKEQPFTREKSKGLKIAVVGAGPAGLSCAHKLATLGYTVTVFEAQRKSGGLNEYGLAPYKLTNNFAQQEVDFILSVGGIEVKHSQRLGRDISLSQLKKDFAAVFLGVGLADTNKLGLPGEEQAHVFDAAAFIAKIRQADDASQIPIGKNVIVIGGGNTAVDIAIQAKKLGADSVTIAYRRGQEQMGATPYEQELAQKKGVLILPWVKPVRIEKDTMEFEKTELKNDKLIGTGQMLFLKADQIFKAIGQTLASELSELEISQGKIKVTENFETTMPGVFAGGDCIQRGEDLTVTAVQHGKLAALSIHQSLGAKSHG